MRRITVVTAVTVFLAGAALPALADWDPRMPAKYFQLPNLDNGMDVNATYNGQYPFVKMLADDFPCYVRGPVTDIHIWGSWLFDDGPNPNTSFRLSIYDDVPAGPDTYSRPGKELWYMEFGPDKYTAMPVHTGLELFYEPNTREFIGDDMTAWQYNFYIPASEAFVQEGSAAARKVYWLAVQAWVPGPEVFGWKTSLEHWNDDAVYADRAPGTIPGAWQELRLPTGPSLDLAFAITPEPATLALLAAGAVGLIARRRRS